MFEERDLWDFFLSDIGSLYDLFICYKYFSALHLSGSVVFFANRAFRVAKNIIAY